MYKILVVDDETLIADGMASLFTNCADLSLEVYKCYSAIEALQLMEDIQFDIILTDIVMPQMNGLELLKVIKQKWPLCYVVFLTGYGDFKYVYEAIQYPNVKYLLKAEGSKKIIQVIKELINSKHLMGVNETAEDRANDQNKNLQRDIIAGILMGEIQDIDGSLFELNHIMLDYDRPLHLCLIRIGAIENILPFYEKVERYNQISRDIENKIGQFANLYMLSFDYVNTTCLLQLKDKCGLQEILEKLWTIYETYFNDNIMFILDSSMIDWHQCSMRYLFLKRLMNENGLRDGGVLLTEEIIEKELISNNSNLMKENIRVNSLLSAYLERGDSEAFFLLFDKVTKDLTVNQSMHKNSLLEKYYDIATIYLACINRNNLRERLSSKVNLYKLMRVDYHTDWKNAVEYLRDLGHNIFYILNNSLDGTDNDVLANIYKYIEENLYGDLTLSGVADAIGMNPSYLSRFYKRMTGKKFSDYISKKKIEEGKELLQRSDKSVSEISTLLGYSSSSNFIRFFRKEVGLTPYEYREVYKK